MTSGGAFRLRGRLGGVVYDYLISNDNPSGPGSWNAVLSLGGATLAGKVVAIAPGTYSPQTIALSGSGTVTFTALNPNNMPLIKTNGVVNSSPMSLGANTLNLTFQYIDLGYDMWTASSSRQVVGYAGNISSTITWSRCRFRGAYGTSLANSFDPASPNYGEYARIRVASVSGGAVTGLTIVASYIANILADGVYDLKISTPGTGFIGTMTVTGGNIVSTSITNGGSGYTAATGSPPLGGSFVEWVNGSGVSLLVRMSDGLAYGHQAVSGTFSGNLVIDHCSFYLLRNCVKHFPRGVGSQMTITNNSMDVCYEDYLSFVLGTGLVPPNTTIAFNEQTRPFSQIQDPGAGHPDALQFSYGNFTTVAEWNVTLQGNLYWIGNARGGNQGVPFAADNPGTTAFGYSGRICGNLILSAIEGNMFVWGVSNETYAYGNVHVRYDYTNATVNPTAAVFWPTKVKKEMLYGASIVEAYNVVDMELAGLDITSQPNAVLGVRGATIPYTDVFVSPGSLPTTAAAVKTAFATKGAYAGMGPQANGYVVPGIDGTIDLTKEPTWALNPYPQPQAALSTTLNSEWRKIMGGPATGTWSISGAGFTVQFADDVSGTNATAPSSAGGTYTRDKYYRMNFTTGAANLVTNIGQLTLRTTVIPWLVTTRSVATFATANNQNAAWSKASATPDTASNINRCVYAFEFTPTTMVAADKVCSASNGIAAGGHWQFGQQDSAHCSMILDAPVLLNQVVRHVIIIDYTVSSIAGKVRWYMNGVLQTGTVGGTVGTSQTLNMNILLANFSIFANNGSNIADGILGFYLFDYGNAGAGYTLPNESDPIALNNLFSADNLNQTNGVTSALPGGQPKIFINGDATAFNAGFANKGSLATFSLNKQAGTYI